MSGFVRMGGSAKTWWTPRWLINSLAEEFHFSWLVDMAADNESSVAPVWIDAQQDSTKLDWLEVYSAEIAKANVSPRVKSLWCNPPWGNIGPFLECAQRANREAADTGKPFNAIFLLPSRLEAKWGQYSHDADLYVLAPRINYFDPEAGYIRTGNGIGSILLHFAGVRGKAEWRRLDVGKGKTINARQ